MIRELDDKVRGVVYDTEREFLTALVEAGIEAETLTGYRGVAITELGTYNDELDRINDDLEGVEPEERPEEFLKVLIDSAILAEALLEPELSGLKIKSDKKVGALEKEIAALEKRKDILDDTPGIDPEEFLDRIIELDDEIDRLEELKEDLLS